MVVGAAVVAACVAYMPSAAADGQPTGILGWSVAPAGATTGTPTVTTLHDQPGAPPARAALSGLERIDGVTAGEPVLIGRADGTLSGATLTRRLDAPVPPGSRATLAYYDAGRDAWTAVPTRLSTDRTTLTATVGRRSYWTVLLDDVSVGIGAALGTRGSAPDCPLGVPAWLKPEDTAFLDDGTAPLRWCTGRDPRDPALLVVKVRVERGYGVGLAAAATPERVSDSQFASGPEDVLVGVMTGALRLPQDFGRGLLVLPGGTEAELTFSEEAVRTAGGGPLIRIEPTPEFMIAGLTYAAITELDPEGDRPAAMLAALIGTARCRGDIVGPTAVDDPPEATAAARTCLAGHTDEIGDDLAAALMHVRPAGRATSPGASARSTGRRLWQVWAAGVPFGVATWFADRALPPAAWTFQVSPDATGVRVGDLLGAPVPALCRHPAGRLQGGELPAVPGSPGYVALLREDPQPVFADLTGDGAGDAAAVVRCTAGGVTWPDTVVFYGPGPTLLGAADLWRVTEAENFEHSTVSSLTADGTDVVVRWTTTDGCCFNAKFWTARLHWDGRAVRILEAGRA
jgi:hypothetical protein